MTPSAFKPDFRLGILGTGKMGCAIAGSLLRKTFLSPDQLIGFDPHLAARDSFLALSPAHPLGWANRVDELVANCSCLLLAVKPQQMREALAPLRAAKPELWYLSIAAGIPLARLEAYLGEKRAIVRVMPNTPLQVGEGVSAFTLNRHATRHHHAMAMTIFGSSGVVYEVSEEQLDVITALSGSGPAFAYHFIACLAKAGQEEGLDPGQALTMAAQTVRGASRLLLESSLSPEELIAHVASKGGTTEAGLTHLQTDEFRQIIRQTIKAATERSRELSES
jgi:pyrroline-5-carboxylate reductase